MLPGWEILKGLFIGDVHNGFNNLSRLAMMWTVRHRWPGGARFDFNCYRHSVQLLVRRPGEVETEILLIKEGVTQGNPLSMVLYGLILSVLAEQIRVEYPGFLQS